MIPISPLNNPTPRELLLRTAQLFEEHPKVFHFANSRQPIVGCNTPGCALGWMASLARIPTHRGSDRFDPGRLGEFLGYSGEFMFETVFYNRMNKLSPSEPCWTRDAGTCAKALRLYADVYHPA
jgi:hypothetical protein